MFKIHCTLHMYISICMVQCR